MLFLGICSALVTGCATPANTYLFGRLADSMITQGSNTVDDDLPPNMDQLNEEFWDEIVLFAIYNSVIGAAMFIFSYTATMLFNYAAHNQVS